MNVVSQQSAPTAAAPRRLFRRGPWENAATFIIALGVVMLCQPFVLALYTYSFITILLGVVMFTIVTKFRIEQGAMAEIKVDKLHKSFGDFIAVKQSDFTIRHGEFFCLLGPSGCGKTTTLRMIAGLELPTSGRIFLDDEDVSYKRAAERDIAFVFQLFALYPHMSVRQNIGFPLKSQGMGRAEIAERIGQAAQTLQISHLLDRSVSGLSSGDRQRVALGRAIVRQPKAFLMDEPLGALDTEFRHIMTGELRSLHDRLNATTIYVTHDQLEAMAMADKIAVMNRGLIEQIGAPREIYDRPASLFVADFIGSPPMNFLTFRGKYREGRR